MARKLGYQEAFAREGIAIAKGQNVPWGVVGKDGILRWMGHKVHFHNNQDGVFVYEDRGLMPGNSQGLDAKVKILTEYGVGKPIRIMQGVFDYDGKNEGGVYEGAEFSHATGSVFVGEIHTWDPQLGIFICVITKREDL